MKRGSVAFAQRTSQMLFGLSWMFFFILKRNCIFKALKGGARSSNENIFLAMYLDDLIPSGLLIGEQLNFL